MIVLRPTTQAERFEILLWASGQGPETQAVRRFVVAQRLTFAAALITRADFGSLDDVVRN